MTIGGGCVSDPTATRHEMHGARWSVGGTSLASRGAAGATSASAL